MSRYPHLGGDFSAVHDNLTSLDRRQERLLEMRMSHHREWAEVLTQLGSEGRDALLHMLDALHPDRPVPLPSDIPSENRAPLEGFYRHFSAPERLMLLQAVLRNAPTELLHDPSTDPPEVSDRALGKVAYVQNSFSDSAYLTFSHKINHPRAAYFDSFSDVCEEVYNGICEYGILPILHSREGKLFRFYTLLEKYDLRVTLACDLSGTERDGGATTRYALIRRALPGERTDKVTHIDLLLPADGEEGGGQELCDLLAVCRACDLLPTRLDTRPTGDGDRPDALTHQITLTRAPKADSELTAFLAYLALCMPRCTVLGLYRILPAST